MDKDLYLGQGHALLHLRNFYIESKNWKKKMENERRVVRRRKEDLACEDCPKESLLEDVKTLKLAQKERDEIDRKRYRNNLFAIIGIGLTIATLMITAIGLAQSSYNNAIKEQAKTISLATKLAEKSTNLAEKSSELLEKQARFQQNIEEGQAEFRIILSRSVDVITNIVERISLEWEAWKITPAANAQKTTRNEDKIKTLEKRIESLKREIKQEKGNDRMAE